MTKLATRLKPIRRLEKFALRVFSRKSGRRLSVKKNSVIGAYPHKYKLPDAKRVADYIRRFEKTYPGLTCKVMERTGKKLTVADARKLLKNVRLTY